MNGELYVAFLDEKYIGIADNEYEAFDIAEEETHGNRPLYDDEIPDRFLCCKINVNRWVQCEESPKCIEDKYSGKSIMCSSTSVQNTLDTLNKEDLARERAEARVRALFL